MPLWNRFKSFAIQSKRVWHILKKPSSKEFKTVAKISAIGILIMGAVGFLVATLIKSLGNIFA
ncbi:protein translocase SEC61 complex subunit gamma [Candidatus Pacearchaeota archaeon]|nr:protein translocase SEC61 complex subunit gamma [Candidatus Pacearchaeota archaeon]